MYRLLYVHPNPIASCQPSLRILIFMKVEDDIGKCAPLVEAYSDLHSALCVNLLGGLVSQLPDHSHCIWLAASLALLCRT